MTLRTKLLTGYGGFILAMVVLGAWSARTMSQMSTVSLRIISENYDSVVAAEHMKESLERLDSAALFDQLEQHDRALLQIEEHRARFDAALATAAANLTEPGEPAIVSGIERGRSDYFRLLDEFQSTSGDRRGFYFEQLEPRFTALRADCDRLLNVNQEAMRRKAGAASATARHWFILTVILGLVLIGLGTAIQIRLSRAILHPVTELTAATARVAAGDFKAVVPVQSHDEIGALALGFNRMAERIRELRQSDLGKVLVAQHTAEAVIDSLDDPVLVTDRDGHITRVNGSAEAMFGARQAVVGKSLNVVTSDARIVQAVSDVLQSAQPAGYETGPGMLPWSGAGPARAFRIRSTPMRDADDRLVGAVTLLEDVTHFSEINRMKSEFIAAASHELRTPLTSVQLGLHLLIEGSAGTLDDRQRHILEICRADTERLERLMRQLLDLSKVESQTELAARDTVRSSALVQDAIESLRLQFEAKGVRLASEIPPDLPAIRVDRAQLSRVVVNLVSNALKATPSGGSVQLSAVARDGHVAFSVTDSGVGIPREYLTRIFEPFVQVPQSAPGGSGLGLTISRRIVEAHGGQMGAQSEIGHGSTFTFTIPLETP